MLIDCVSLKYHNFSEPQFPKQWKKKKAWISWWLWINSPWDGSPTFLHILWAKALRTYAPDCVSDYLCGEQPRKTECFPPEGQLACLLHIKRFWGSLNSWFPSYSPIYCGNRYHLALLVLFYGAQWTGMSSLLLLLWVMKSFVSDLGVFSSLPASTNLR